MMVHCGFKVLDESSYFEPGVSRRTSGGSDRTTMRRPWPIPGCSAFFVVLGAPHAVFSTRSTDLLALLDDRTTRAV